MEKIFTQEEIRKFLSDKVVEISKDFKENNITWWAKGGTIIGAVLHGDVIPWDDDIDMGMELSVFFENKQKIITIVRKHGFTLYDKYSKEGKGIDYLKLTYKDKMIVSFNDHKYEFRPFIDVMLASSVERESKKESITWKYSNHFKHLYSSWYAPYPRYGYDLEKKRSVKKRTLISILIFPFTVITRIIVPSFIFRKAMHKIDFKREKRNKNSKYVAYNYAPIKLERNLLLRREVKWVKFGSGELPLNIDYEKELKFIYGEINIPEEKFQFPSHYTSTPFEYKKGKAKLEPFTFK